MARCSKCDYVFGFKNEGHKNLTFRKHYTQHLTGKRKMRFTKEEIEEVTASLVTLLFITPAAVPAPALARENGVTVKDTEPKRQPLELDCKAGNRRPATEVNFRVCRIL